MFTKSWEHGGSAAIFLRRTDVERAVDFPCPCTHLTFARWYLCDSWTVNVIGETAETIGLQYEAPKIDSFMWLTFEIKLHKKVNAYSATEKCCHNHYWPAEIRKDGSETKYDDMRYNDGERSWGHCKLSSLSLRLTPSNTVSLPSFVTDVWPITTICRSYPPPKITDNSSLPQSNFNYCLSSKPITTPDIYHTIL